MKSNESAISKFDWLCASAVFSHALVTLFFLFILAFVVNHGINLLRAKREADIAAVPMSMLNKMISECQAAEVRFTKSELKEITYEEMWKHRNRCQVVAENIQKGKEIDAIVP